MPLPVQRDGWERSCTTPTFRSASGSLAIYLHVRVQEGHERQPTAPSTLGVSYKHRLVSLSPHPRGHGQRPAVTGPTL